MDALLSFYLEIKLITPLDALLEKTARAMAYNSASPRAVASLQNWVNGNRCITREETAFLHHLDDLIEICPTSDDIFVKLESWVEDGLLHFYKGFRQVSFEASAYHLCLSTIPVKSLCAAHDTVAATGLRCIRRPACAYLLRVPHSAACPYGLRAPNNFTPHCAHRSVQFSRRHGSSDCDYHCQQCAHSGRFRQHGQVEDA